MNPKHYDFTPPRPAAADAPILSVLAIDPGAQTGWAMFQASDGRPWHLTACGVASPGNRLWPGPWVIDLVVIENPQIYPGSKVPPGDILTLARIVGRYEERFAHAGHVELVPPRAWKGSVNGDIMLRRIEAALTPDEASVVAVGLQGVPTSYRHNAIDAIGLGKWAIKQKSLCPRAR